MVQALLTWLKLHRQQVFNRSAAARAIEYSLRRWAALTRYRDDGMLPAYNNGAENRIRPIPLGKNT